MALRRQGDGPTETEKARARLREQLARSDGLTLPPKASACGLCGRRAGRDGLVRHEEITRDSHEIPPVGWSEVRRVRADPTRDVFDVTWRRSWRLCGGCRFAHDLAPEHEWPALAVLLVVGCGPPYEPGQVSDAGRTAAELGPMVYKVLGRPADRGTAEPWRHVEDVGKVRARFAELQAVRAFAAEYGTVSATGAPCWVCGVTHCEQWGKPPRPEMGARPRPGDLAVCGVCAFEWLRRHEDTHGTIPSSLADWAASQAAGAVSTVEGLAARVGFPLAHAHPGFRDVQAGAFRAPWAYLGSDDLDALAGHVAGRRVAPRPDGRLRIPQGVPS